MPFINMYWLIKPKEIGGLMKRPQKILYDADLLDKRETVEDAGIDLFSGYINWEWMSKASGP